MAGLRERSRIDGRLGLPKLLSRLLQLTLVAVATAASAQPASMVPSYLIEAVAIRGNHKTHDAVIRRVLAVEAGQQLAADDPRFALSRYRVLSLGHFSHVQLRLERGSRRGQAVLVVDVVERGTLVLTDLFLGASEATPAWGGLGLAERNFLGRGLGLEGAFVLGADPDVERARLQQAYWLALTTPRLARGGLAVSAGFLFLDGSEFFRRAGGSGSSDPDDFISSRYRRFGGMVGAGFHVSRFTRVRLDQRLEAVRADIPLGRVRRLPSGDSTPIAFDIIDGNSLLSVASIVVERDTRSDPVTPRAGGLLSIAADVSTRLLGSRYSYLKFSASYRHYFRLRWQHLLAMDLFGGVVFGEAPFFEKYFIGDLNDLVPSRSLGLNFSTLPSRNIFGTSIDDKRYDEIALRPALEYIVPWFRGGGFAYSGDFFVNVGLLFLASREDLELRDQSLPNVVPVDLTVDAGLRLDTSIGIFRVSVGNALGRIPF